MRPSVQLTDRDNTLRTRIRRYPVKAAPVNVSTRRSVDGLIHPRPHSPPKQAVVPKSVRRAASQVPSVPKQQRSAVLLRQAVAAPKSMRRKNRQKLTKSRLLIPALAVAVFGFGVYVSFDGWRTNRQVQAQVGQIKNTPGANNAGDREIPDETPPGDIGNYAVSPDMPRYIRVNKIRVNARVFRMGVRGGNQLAAPGNVYDVGWYDGSSKPGEHGAMLVDGHVHGPTAPGVFYNLKNLTEGDEIEIERGDGKKFIYKVHSKKSYEADKVDMNAALVSAEAGKPGLNLITCDGTFNSSSSTYSNRLVVFAVLQ